MPTTPPLIRIGLDEISTGYTVFEKDQVLTEKQLNGVADYFDDETRLSRVKLIGVGVICGLRVARSGDTVRISHGVGVTTDGDLLRLAADTVFDRYKAYDPSSPTYASFFNGATMISAYQLVASGVTDDRAVALSQLTTPTGAALADLVAVLYLESYVKDNDLCSGTDCDNTGQLFTNNLRVLLVAKSAVGILQSTLKTVDVAAAALRKIVASRVAISSSLTTYAQLAAAYAAACRATLTELNAQLPRFYAGCSPWLGGLFATDPSGEWATLLAALQQRYASRGIQYYYDLLKDLVETYNQILELLALDRTICCPEAAGFPKHVLLGNVVPGAEPDENRTPFYPSPATSCTACGVRHAVFLVRKFDAMIRTFEVPDTATGTVRITPSQFEDRALEERAIPFYYRITPGGAIHQTWNHRLHLERRDAWNYSYNAAAYGAQGGAASPFTAQVGAYPFFRIEGCLGMEVSAAVTAVESLIKANNLPLAVRAVLLGTDRTAVVRKPGIRYTDLHRFHQLLRQDVASQVDDVLQFSGKFQQQLHTDVSDREAPGIKTIADVNHRIITEKVASARPALGGTYTNYLGKSNWQNDVRDTMTAAASFKYNVGSVMSDRLASNVVKTEFTTPFDTLVSGLHPQWLGWLDQIIATKDQAEDDKLLFGNFVTQNPGTEHFAGVLRGGTFLLVHDSTNVVVADFMLPYHLCETPPQPPPEEPVLTRTWPRPGAVDLNYGIRITQPLPNYLDEFKATKILPEIDDKLMVYDKSFTTSVQLVTGALKNPSLTIDQTTVTPKLDIFSSYVDALNAQQRQIDLILQSANNTTLPQDQRDRLVKQATVSQTMLAQMANSASDYVANSAVDVSAGSEAHNTLLAVSSAAQKITDPAARKVLQAGLAATREKATNSNAALVIGSIGQNLGKTAAPDTTAKEAIFSNYVESLNTQQRQIDLINQSASDTTLTAEQRDRLAKQAAAAQATLAQVASSASDYIANNAVDVSAGSEAHNTLLAVSSASLKITDPAVRKALQVNLTTTKDKATNPNAALVIGSIGQNLGKIG